MKRSSNRLNMTMKYLLFFILFVYLSAKNLKVRQDFIIPKTSSNNCSEVRLGIRRNSSIDKYKINNNHQPMNFPRTTESIFNRKIEFGPPCVSCGSPINKDLKLNSIIQEKKKEIFEKLKILKEKSRKYACLKRKKRQIQKRNMCNNCNNCDNCKNCDKCSNNLASSTHPSLSKISITTQGPNVKSQNINANFPGVSTTQQASPLIQIQTNVVGKDGKFKNIESIVTTIEGKVIDELEKIHTMDVSGYKKTNVNSSESKLSAGEIINSGLDYAKYQIINY